MLFLLYFYTEGMRQVKSSNVTSAAYNNKSKTLKVQFHGGSKPGRNYAYQNVPLTTYRAITTQKSPGKAVWKRLRRAGIQGTRLG